MKKSLQNFFFALVKPLIGTNVSKYIPFSQTLYRWMFGALTGAGVTTLDYQGLRLSIYDKDTSVGAFLRLKGEYEPLTTQLFREKIPSGGVVFDVGANIGTFTVLAAQKVGPKGQVFAFEPDPENAKLLRQNLDQNGFQNTVVTEAAIGDHPGQIFLSGESKNKGGVQIQEHGEKAVQMITLDQFAAEKAITAVDVLKIDIEGAELMAFAGGQKILKNSPNLKLFMEINPEAFHAFHKGLDDVMKAVKSLGVTPKLLIDEHDKKRISFSKEALAHALKQYGYINVYAER